MKNSKVLNIPNSTHVFDHLDYKNWIQARIQSEPNTYGIKKLLAEAAQCQRSYISQVLNSKSDFTLEQAERIARHFDLPESESLYFIRLVEYSRAGSKDLKTLFKNELDRFRQSRENLAERISEVDHMVPTDAAVYYSSWHYSAIHILVSIPEFASIPSIAERLNLPKTVVSQTLDQLTSMGLVKNEGGNWVSTYRQLHLPRESPFTSANHSNWRGRAVQSSYIQNTNAIHYTGVSSIAKEDVDKLRKLIFKIIDESREVISPSREEELICMNLDLFTV